MRTVLIAAVLLMVLIGCTPADPARYAQVVCADQDGLAPGSDEDAACTQYVAENSPKALLAIGGAMLGPLKAAPDVQHASLSSHRHRW